MRLGLTAAHTRAGRRVVLVLPLVDGAGSSTFPVAASVVLADCVAVFLSRLAAGLSPRVACGTDFRALTPREALITGGESRPRKNEG
jgi:hypothetical protein